MTPESWNVGCRVIAAGIAYVYLKGMRLPMFQLSGLYVNGSCKGSTQEKPQNWNIITLKPLRQSIRHPSTNHPKPMFQLSGVRYTGTIRVRI